MLQKLIDSIQSFCNTHPTSNDKIICYHCGEKSIPSRTIYVYFGGASRAVCCNGCAAILMTVEELGIQDEYHANKINIPHPNE